MNMNWSDQVSRPAVATEYRNHLIRTLGYQLPAFTSAEEIIACAKSVTPPPYEAEQGWRTEPPFPGLADRPEETPAGWRMACACRLMSGDRELGVIFVTFFGGRPMAAVVSPPETEIPKQYSPISAM